jgi:hypothetical protein
MIEAAAKAHWEVGRNQSYDSRWEEIANNSLIAPRIREEAKEVVVAALAARSDGTTEAEKPRCDWCGHFWTLHGDRCCLAVGCNCERVNTEEAERERVAAGPDEAREAKVEAIADALLVNPRYLGGGGKTIARNDAYYILRALAAV